MGIDVTMKGKIKPNRPWPLRQKFISPMKVTIRFKVNDVVGMI
jgi:hypothetical protein